MAYFALTLLGEYKRIFFENPQAAMSFEVWSQLLFHPAATPAYLGVLVLFFGIWFIVIGLFVLTLMVGETVVELAHRWFPLSFPRTLM
ncbi:hypothetical protein AGMMS50256_12950 [Betaproteobacteria bacterium]|nr:hypothetical protein AGMMS50256_12950 [Betaproteobacteria bacterium]